MNKETTKVYTYTRVSTAMQIAIELKKQWLKSITFRLPIITEDISLSLDNNEGVECVVLLSKHS